MFIDSERISYESIDSRILLYPELIDHERIYLSWSLSWLGLTLIFVSISRFPVSTCVKPGTNLRFENFLKSVEKFIVACQYLSSVLIDTKRKKLSFLIDSTNNTLVYRSNIHYQTINVSCLNYWNKTTDSYDGIYSCTCKTIIILLYSFKNHYLVHTKCANSSDDSDLSIIKILV